MDGSVKLSFTPRATVKSSLEIDGLANSGIFETVANSLGKNVLAATVILAGVSCGL